MQTHAALRSEEAREAAWSGARGAVVGATKVCYSPTPSETCAMGIDNTSGGYMELS